MIRRRLVEVNHGCLCVASPWHGEASFQTSREVY